MLTVVYLANLVPSPVEPYVVDEIRTLRERGVQVLTSSVRTPDATASNPHTLSPDIVLQSLKPKALIRALILCVSRWTQISPLIRRLVVEKQHSLKQRIKAVIHTFLGAYFAALLEPYSVDHIHAHHGYFGSWVGMTAARLLDVSFSMTLHGSDLFLRAAYLETKLANCAFCLTISQYNRQYLLTKHPAVDPKKVIVSRLGVAVADHTPQAAQRSIGTKLSLLAVGRLQPVKNHAFLIEACAWLNARGVDFECSIAGDGPERRRLESLIRVHDLEDRVTLLGHVAREQMDSLYDRADLLVLTSHSEGIPLVLMEAMARGKVVLAPAITGIPELVIAGKTGFLYQPGSLEDFVSQVTFIGSLMQAEQRAGVSPTPLHWIRHAARLQVLHNFNRQKNLNLFSNVFLSRVTPRIESLPYEDLVLQQI